MDYKITVTKKYIGFPIKAEQELETLELWDINHKLYEFRVPLCKKEKIDYSLDYYSYLNVEKLIGKEIKLKGDFTDAFFQSVIQSEEAKLEELERPNIHFTANRGWINDPNGLVYQDGIYHLYFQYNPFDTKWENMSWGHAVSEDLLHWTCLDSVMYPDEYGTIFSGCAIINEKTMLDIDKNNIIYFYTAAGSNSEWSKGKEFIQRVAYSKDGGNTLNKLESPILNTICKENRDPKVFWHEESKAYIMVLWLEKNEFGIFRSKDLEKWECSQRLELKEAWECPDLMELSTEDGEKKWVFESADGYYFIGTFDGYTFISESERLFAYGTKLPYAAQSYSGVKGRTISIPWFRTKHEGRLYTGSMGIPRELSLMQTKFGLRMRMKPVREYEVLKKVLYAWSKNSQSSICLEYKKATEDAFETEVIFTEIQEEAECKISVLGQELIVSKERTTISYENEVFSALDKISQISIIFDKGIVEITCNYGMLYLVFETEQYKLNGDIIVSGSNISDIHIFSI